MANLEELVVSLVAETQGLKAELNSATKITQASTDKMEKAIKDFTDSSSKSMGFWQTTMATATGFLGSQAVLGAFNAFKDAAIGLFNTFVTDGIKAAQQQEDAINKLNTALAISGQYTRETSKDLQAYASSLQATTKYGDEAVLETAALIQSLGGLEKEGLKKATSATLDMASALGIDLKAAATLVGKAATGEISSFTRYGVVIEKGATQAETFARALDAISSKFGGTAQAQVKTFSGGITQLNNAFGDMTEITGQAITENQAVIAVLNQLNTIIAGTTSELDGNKTAMKELVANGIIFLADSLAGVMVGFDAFARIGGAAVDVVETAFVGLGMAVTGVLKVFNSDYEEAFNAFSMQAEEVAKRAEQRFSGDTFLSDVSEKLFQIGDAARDGLGEIRKGADAAIEPTNAAKAAVVELSAEEQKRLDLIKEFATAYADQGMALSAQYDYDLELLKSNLDMKLVTEEDYLTSRQEMLDGLHETELAQLQEARANQLITEAEFANAKTALEQKQHLDSVKLAQERLKTETELNKKRTEDFKSTLGTISSLSSSNNKALAAAGKAAAITNATIDGYAAIQKALASAPPPINFGLAALVGAATAQNISKIKSVGLNTGGTLRGGGANSDTIAASLTQGETVVDRTDTERLSRFLDRAESGAGGDEPTAKVELVFSGDALVEFVETKILERRRMGISVLGSV